MTTSSRQSDRHVAASDIASLCFCEQKVQLDHEQGETVSEVQAAARARGIEVHKRVDLNARKHHNETASDRSRGNHCFIASQVYGYDDPRTWQLRQFRDSVLLPTMIGRKMVEVYYRHSPQVVRFLHGRSAFTVVARLLIDVIRITTSPRMGDFNERATRRDPGRDDPAD